MAVILFKKGTGTSQKFNEFGFEYSLENGWCLTKEEALADKPKERPPEAMSPDTEIIEIPGQVDDPKNDETEIRQRAKEKGIRNWHNMKLENLVKKLDDQS